MAGDWIKMRVDLGTDPAVIQIADRLNASEDEVVGKLHRLWSWADRHTSDGKAPSITPRWVNKYVDKPGFAEAMVEAGWLAFDEFGVIFPSFDVHNSESAKRRADNTLRQRLCRRLSGSGNNKGRNAIPRPFVKAVMERDNYQCVYCGAQSSSAQELSRKKILSIDHIYPTSRGGGESVDCLATACQQCNNEKNDRTPEEWGMMPSFIQPGLVYANGHIRVTSLSQNNVTKALPEKRREEKNNPPYPPCLNTTKFDDAWGKWREHKKHQGYPVQPMQEIELLTKLATEGSDEATEIVLHAIRKGWRSIVFDYPERKARRSEQPYLTGPEIMAKAKQEQEERDRASQAATA